MDVKTLMQYRTPIFLTGEVDERMLQALDAGLKEVSTTDHKTATIFLTTHGGRVSFGEAIAERLEMANKIFTLNMVGATFVQSAGVQIFLVLPKEQRFVTKRCEIMIHPHKQGMKHLEGVAALDEIERRLQEEQEHVRHGRALEARIIRKLVSTTGIKKKELLELYRKSHRFSAQEAVRLNLASAIVC